MHSPQVLDRSTVRLRRLLPARLLKSPEPQVGRRRPYLRGSGRQEEQANMVTNYPHPVTSNQGVRAAADETQADGFGVIDRLRQMFCGLHGHDNLLQFEQERMFLRCASCGHETPGWSLNEAPPTVTARGDARRHAVVQPQFISVRRIA